MSDEIKKVNEEVTEVTNDEPVEINLDAQTQKPIVQIKFLDANFKSAVIKNFTNNIKGMLENLTAQGYIPVVTSKDVEFSITELDTAVAVVAGMPITVQDIINTKNNKFGDKSVVYDEEDVTNFIKEGAKRIEAIDNFINNINAKIQMVFPNNSELYSCIVLDKDYRVQAALTGSPAYAIQSNNPIFTNTITSLVEANKDENGNVDVLAILNAYLDNKIREENSKVIKRDSNGNPTEKIVSLDEVVAGMNANKEEEETEEAEEVETSDEDADSEE